MGILRAKAREGDLTLVYGSRDEEHNAAVALKLYLEGQAADVGQDTASCAPANLRVSRELA